MRHRLGAATALVTLCMFASGALAHDGTPQRVGDDDLRGELERLRELVEDQARRIDELEQRPAADGRALDEAVARHVAAMRTGAPGELRLVSRTKRGASFQLYGFVRADAIWNDSRAALNNQVIGWALSEDPTAPVGVGAGGKNRDDFTVHPRLSRLGLDFDGGTVSRLGDAHVTGKVEIDFYEGGSQSRSRVRMRKAYVDLAWENVSLLAGQTTDLIAPLYASVNADLAMWGAGNLGDRRPQIRLTYRRPVGEATMSLAGMLGQTGALDASNLDGPGTFGATISDGQKSGKPTLQARMAYQRTIEDAGPLEIGVWVHRAWEDPDTRVGIKSESEIQSSGWGLDAQIPLIENRLWLKGEWFAGRNLDDVRGGIFQGVNAITGEAISTKGGFVELGVRATDWMTWHVGASEDDPDRDDLGLGGRDENDVWWIATRMQFGPVQLGVEYLNWKTEFVGFDDGELERVAVYIAYSF